MKPIKKIFSIFSILALMLFMAGAVSAQVTLDIGSETVDASVNNTVSVNVTVDNPSQIAGAAFTVLYDTEDLTLTSVTSTFFDTFANQGITPTSVIVGGETYTQPLVTNDIPETNTMMGGTMIAAARVQAGATNTTVFTLTFDLTNAFNGTYPIMIVPSTINNPDAGWNGEASPMLVGALDPSIPPESAFPEIPVNMPPDGPIAGSITVTGSTNYDLITLDIDQPFNVDEEEYVDTAAGGEWHVWFHTNTNMLELNGFTIKQESIADFAGWAAGTLPDHTGFTATTWQVTLDDINKIFSIKIAEGMYALIKVTGFTSGSLSFNFMPLGNWNWDEVPDGPEPGEFSIANKMTLAADKTTIASDGKGSAVLTATILDAFDNLVDDDTTDVIFTFTDYNDLTLSAPATVKATDGTADLTVTTAAGDVDPSPSTTDASITSFPDLTPPASQTLSIVNFSATADYTALVTSGTPHEALITAVGATNYTWSKTSGDGILVDNGDGTATFTAPTSITEGTTGHLTVIHVVDADNTSVTFDLTLTTYEPLSITSPTSAAGIALGDTTQGVTVSGGTGTYKFQSNATTVATVDADGGGVTPEAKGACNIQVRDATHGVFATENGFYAVTPTIEIVDPITVTPATKSLDASGTQPFTASGGKGGYAWSCDNADAGAIDATTGVFTAAAVTATQTATITATDGTYTDINGTATVTVYAGMVISETPAGYVDGTPSTYPLLNLGETITLKAADNTRNYDWIITSWIPGTAAIVTQLTGAADFVVDPDDLFTAAGAGIYTVTLTDQDNPGLTPTTLNVRVPMKFVATKFAAAAVKDAGTYKTDTDANDTYTVNGGSAVVDVYNFSAFDLNSVEVVAADVGAFTDASPTDNDNVFTFAAGIDSMQFYRVKVALDSASDDADVARLIDAGLDTLWSGIFRVIPIVSYSGTVVDSDGSPVGGAMVVCTSDITKIATTDNITGDFTITGFSNTGVTYKFFIQKDGYIDKIVTGDEIEAGDDIVLEALVAGSGAIEGVVSLSDDPTYASDGLVSIQVKTAAGDYIKDGDRNIITSLADPDDGDYSFPVPADYISEIASSFTVEAKKMGYIDNEKCAGFGVTDVTLSESALTATGANIPLYPVTIITVTGTRQDSTDLIAGTNYDQVLVEITAEAGLTAVKFDSTATEVGVLDSDGAAITLDTFGSEGVNTWSFTHDAYENFTITVYADVGDDRDVEAGYKATKTWNYIKSATASTEQQITDMINGDTVKNVDKDGTTTVTLPPGGLVGDILDSVTVAIVEVEADPNKTGTGAGAAKITGSEIVEIVLINDKTGEKIEKPKRIEITMKFDTSVVTEDTLDAGGTYVIYTAPTISDMVNGTNITAIDPSRIIQQVDYENGFVTFWVNHLSVFGIGGSSGGGVIDDDNCFIATAAYGSPFESHVEILRDFRDVYLMPTKIGHAFVEAYYRYSPEAAAFIADHESLRSVTRVALLPVVGMSYAALHTTAAQKALITFLMLGLLAGACMTVRRFKIRRTV
ncbi:MAG: CFI-box-CTERM domain-containing protein [Thermodesulfobacteriota bacterium]|nr:CFI-box-CTERM domain-containing protein [Thermodesulfobacteriota bacterium]